MIRRQRTVTEADREAARENPSSAMRSLKETEEQWNAARVLPNKSEWDDAAQQMAETVRQRRDLVDIVRRRIAVRWADMMHELKLAIRTWLGVEGQFDHIDEQVGGLTLMVREKASLDVMASMADMLTFHGDAIEKLRGEFEQATEANVDIFRKFDERTTLNTDNAAEIIRQLHAGLRQVHSHAKVVKVLMQNVLFRKQWNDYLKAEEARARSRAARSIGTPGTKLRGDIMAHAAEALKGGPDSPGEGWEPLACSQCGNTSGWFNPKQTEIKRPESTTCAACTQQPEAPKPLTMDPALDRGALMMSETRRNFERSLAGQETLFLSGFVDGGAEDTVPMFMGVRMSGAEIVAVRAEQRRLLDERRKPESD